MTKPTVQELILMAEDYRYSDDMIGKYVREHISDLTQLAPVHTEDTKEECKHEWRLAEDFNICSDCGKDLGDYGVVLGKKDKQVSTEEKPSITFNAVGLSDGDFLFKGYVENGIVYMTERSSFGCQIKNIDLSKKQVHTEPTDETIFANKIVPQGKGINVICYDIQTDSRLGYTDIQIANAKHFRPVSPDYNRLETFLQEYDKLSKGYGITKEHLKILLIDCLPPGLPRQSEVGEVEKKNCPHASHCSYCPKCGSR